MYISQKLSNYDFITHGFFGRKGGVSTGIYNSLNCGLGSHDKPENIAENRQIVAEKIGIPELTGCYQYHSSKVRIITEYPEDVHERPYSDAIVCTVPNLGISVLTADCGCLLMLEPEARIIAAVHAGWKGILGGVIENTLNTIASLGGDIQKVIACLGPTISQKNYEVGGEVREQFIKQDKEQGYFFKPSSRENHSLFDAPGLIVKRLEKQGINAENLALCTYEDEDNFFSYRRNTHQKLSDYGRQISVIALKG